MNDIQRLQEFFKKYIQSDESAKNDVITECKQALPNHVIYINSIKKIVDWLITNNSERSLQLFIKNVFDIEKDEIDESLIDSMENQIEHSTTRYDTIQSKQLIITSLDGFKLQTIADNFYISSNDIISIDGKNKQISIIEKEDTRFLNYIVEELLGYESERLSYATDESNYYLISDRPLQKKSYEIMVKEDAICSTKEVEYFIDRVCEGLDKEKWVNRILLDLITNQNYRNIADGDRTLDSDYKENNYYVLNNATLKKDISIESLYKNYHDEIRKISNLIIQNYDLILDIIDKLAKSELEPDRLYIENLKNNIALVYEKGKIQDSLDEIEKGESVRRSNNENASENLSNFKNSLRTQLSKVRKNENANEGYASIFVLLGGIMVFGVMLAYLMLKL